MTMQALETARKKVAQLLGRIEHVGEAVVRGERLHGGKCFAVAYVDFADDVVGRAQNLRDFQERILGDDFFNSPGDLRWNKYIYILAGPKSVEQPDFQRAKAVIEADEDFARKRVVSADELDSVLGAAQYFSPSTSSQEFDIVGEWSKLLSEARIDGILDRPARTTMLERIGSGEAGRAASSRKTLALHASDIHLHDKWLSRIRVDSFRAVHDGKKSFEFGQVTLITGPNGTGKTSLLEAIEFFYCGQNRRALTKSAKVYGTLWGSTEEHLATTDSSRLRARCLSWYNREEKTSAGVLNGFGRYNFLDTDAAFRVAADLNPEEMPEDLSRLIVGPDASQIWSYVGKLAPELQTAAERAFLDLQGAQKSLEDSQEALKRLQERPSDAKALGQAFRAGLSQIGYRGNLPTAPFVSADEAKPVQSAYAAVQALLSSGTGFRTIASLQDRRGAIDDAYRTIQVFDTQLAEINEKVDKLERQASEYENWTRLLRRWVDYLQVNYYRVQDEFNRSNLWLRDAEARLGRFVNTDVPSVDPAYEQVPLVDALAGASQGIQSASETVASLEAMSASFSQAATARARTAQELKTAVLAAIEGGASTATCPVCRTTHGEAALAGLIERITSDLAQPSELTELSQKLSAARESHKQWVNWKAFLDYIQQIALQLSISPLEGCGKVVGALSLSRRELVKGRAELQSATEAILILHRAGMSDSENENLLASVTKVPSLSEAPYNLQAVEKQAIAYQNAATSIREQIISLQAQSELVQSGIDLRLTPLFADDWRTRAFASEGKIALVRLREEVGALQRQCDELLANFDVGNDATLSDVEAALAGALRAANEATQAAAREETASASISQLHKQIENDKKHAAEALLRHMNMQKASAALNRLRSELSLESATAKSLGAIGQEINDAFGRIHSPNEYEYAGHEGVLLRSKEGKVDWTLDKVSTGQRAAFALSVFLAVNRTAAKAPPVILIDDPVAHVDDLNALSFLDYLRDLAVTSKKQVFFATADARVAALFSRKFGFLGEDFRKIALVRDAHVD